MEREDKLYIKDLTTRTKRGHLCIRVMRKWNYDGNIPGGPVTYIGLVLADEQANAIYAQIPESDVQRLGSALMLDEVYTIRKFSVRISRLNYVPFDAELMIQMTSFTTVTPSKVPHDLFPKLIYNITPFKDIKTTGPAATKYIDVLGIMVSEGSAKTMCIKGRDQPSTLKEIVIKDLSGAELTVTLWEDCVERFKLQDTTTADPVYSMVVLFCGCLPKKIFGKTQANAGNACRWFLNPDIVEAGPLYDSLKNEPVLVHRPPPAEKQVQIPPNRRVLEYKTISEMNLLDPYSFPEDGCKCNVTILEFPVQQEWWYMGCEVCKKRLWNHGGSYYCSPCKCSTAIPLYKLQFVGTDGSDDARFFCYDAVARQILHCSCDSLLRAVNNAPGLPQQILNAVGREFSFTVGLTEQSFRSMESRVYLVDSCVPKSPAQYPTSSPMLAIQSTPKVYTQKQAASSSKVIADPVSASVCGTTQTILRETAQSSIAEPHLSEPASSPSDKLLATPALTESGAPTVAHAEKSKTTVAHLSKSDAPTTARKRLTYDTSEPQDDYSNSITAAKKVDNVGQCPETPDALECAAEMHGSNLTKPGPRGQGGGLKCSKKM